jgi:hypothetical protein
VMFVPAAEPPVAVACADADPLLVLLPELAELPELQAAVSRARETALTTMRARRPAR